MKGEISKILKNRNNRIKVEVIFSDSRRESIVQAADFYAGLYRRRIIGKDKSIWRYLNSEIK